MSIPGDGVVVQRRRIHAPHVGSGRPELRQDAHPVDDVDGLFPDVDAVAAGTRGGRALDDRGPKAVLGQPVGVVRPAMLAPTIRIRSFILRSSLRYDNWNAAFQFDYVEGAFQMSTAAGGRRRRADAVRNRELALEARPRCSPDPAPR